MMQKTNWQKDNQMIKENNSADLGIRISYFFKTGLNCLL